jgi:hypothetical protein
MYICENCGTQVLLNYGSNRFCSKECARGFSTKAKRLDINKKVGDKLRGIKTSDKPKLEDNSTQHSTKCRVKKIKHCASCNDEIPHQRTYCIKCSNFQKYQQMFRKLKIYDTNVLIANEKAVNLLKEEYFVNKLSLIAIREKYGVQFNTIHFFLNKNGIKLRAQSESQLISYAEGRNNIRTSTVYKHGWHTTWNDKKVFLRSSYEFDYAKELDDHHIDYEVETKQIRYFDSEKKKNRIAIPDFYLVDLNMIVEIKSLYTLNIQNMKDKFTRYRELGFRTKLILDFKEINI